MAEQGEGSPTGDGQYPSRAHLFESRDEEIVQVVYQSDQHGSLVGVESTSLLGARPGDVGAYEAGSSNYGAGPSSSGAANTESAITDQSAPPALGGTSHHEQLNRAASTLPSVAEESAVGNPVAGLSDYEAARAYPDGLFDGATPGVPNNNPIASDNQVDYTNPSSEQQAPAGQGYDATQQPPIYSTINKQPTGRGSEQQQQPAYEGQAADVPYRNIYDNVQQQQQQLVSHDFPVNQEHKSLIDYREDENEAPPSNAEESQPGAQGNENLQDASNALEEISHILTRQRAGAVEKGSFRNNFRKKLGVSVSTNENDLTAYRRQFFDSSGDSNNQLAASDVAAGNAQTDSETEHLSSLPSKFKRTHSVSFNVDSGRSNRHSVDIRNLPSYLTHKRASIVDVAKGAMSSLISSLGGGGGGSGANSASGSAISAGGTHRRDSYPDEEPIFEEPIAPTLSLGQRVAMVRNSGAEFGTVGWIGQLPDVDDDWIVGVIFDNMIGDCDGAYNGVRYFYARTNYAMFVPLTTLTKTDNYIGRPETGTMLSRMSVSLKPGQLISIQRSSIRLQHCFLNAPHQRVGHDVRAVSNRLHCQCHNCGPCAHLTKQGRINALPHFGAHHLPHRKKNSLAHAAVEMLAHHHHHFHEEEEEHEEKDYEFGDNAAHACNFVRYSCCQQSGQPGHEFSSDCGMVRPELLDNLIHAPKAPARRSRPRRPAKKSRLLVRQQQQQADMLEGKVQPAAITNGTLDTTVSNQTNTLGSSSGPESDLAAREARANLDGTDGQEGAPISKKAASAENNDNDDSSYLSSSNSSSSNSSSRASSPVQPPPKPYNYYTYDTSSFRPTTGVYNTIDSQISFMDQQRFVYRRDSAAFMQSPKPSSWSDDYDAASNSSSVLPAGPLGIKRILRCLGCMSKHRASRRRRPQRKLSFRDRVLEYRRRQSTFVPSTLAKPHEDFASHGIILPSSSGSSRRQHRHARQLESNLGQSHNQLRTGAEINSDYSSCSRSSCSSSRSNSPPNFRPDQSGAGNLVGARPYSNQHTTSVTLEHGHSAPNDQLKSSNQAAQQQGQDERSHNNQYLVDEPYQAQLDYGDFSFGDGYNTYAKNKSSRDSALTDLAYTDNTHKSNSSSDTLKYLIDQSINEQVSRPQPMEPAGLNGEIVSPLTTSSANREPDAVSPDGEQYEISSLTASLAENGESDENEENLRQKLEDFSMGPNKDLDQQ